MNIRINKYIADKGICSRRQADELISHGRVTINESVAKLGDLVNNESDEVKVNGKIIGANQNDLEYWAVYKPIGVVSTVSDEQGRDIVTSLVESKARLYPVGRLDINSEGLLILTNDGDFTNELTHPSHQHKKSYRIVAKELKKHNLKSLSKDLERGILIDGVLMRAEQVRSIVKSVENNYLEIELDLITGYNRQIRRMCDKMGLEVRKLTRTGIGKLQLSSLKLSPGQAVKISPSDIL